ncbi:hypothetical protein SCP_0705430 [Sparassis crispa]|uniref:Uncharacterized protein n=1 Tax=Sparassis crispa TaxID=139825 RepID=A0A401GT19_9APHY|nr:hypothetical protein SCP_0705430 [Sparassis crispa]GBE85356.1 hypothetical protein SCP_0705430 [Sparassis crispa]
MREYGHLGRCEDCQVTPVLCKYCLASTAWSGIRGLYEDSPPRSDKILQIRRLCKSFHPTGTPSSCILVDFVSSAGCNAADPSCAPQKPYTQPLLSRTCFTCTVR